MADITMCRDTDCKQRKQCYRYTAHACEYRQSYFVESPREGKECKHFWKVEVSPAMNPALRTYDGKLE